MGERVEMSSTGKLFGMFRWGKAEISQSPGREAAVSPRPANAPGHQRIISFRVDADLDRKLSRELEFCSVSQSSFIRSAIERALRADAQERLKSAHAAIRWD
jgi:hypothetical protein